MIRQLARHTLSVLICCLVALRLLTLIGSLLPAKPNLDPPPQQRGRNDKLSTRLSNTLEPVATGKTQTTTRQIGRQAFANTHSRTRVLGADTVAATSAEVTHLEFTRTCFRRVERTSPSTAAAGNAIHSTDVGPQGCLTLQPLGK